MKGFSVSNVNSVIEAVEDIWMPQGCFCNNFWLNEQIKAAAADEGAPVVIEFADEAAVETAQSEKEQEIIEAAEEAAKRTEHLLEKVTAMTQLKVRVTQPEVKKKMK